MAGSIVLLRARQRAGSPRSSGSPAASGVGLTFAAVSNTCLMGTLLMQLPYNQGPGCDIDEAIAKLRREQPEEPALT